jgi:hypothetical protein
MARDVSGNLVENLPHPLTFYYDLFATAHGIVLSRGVSVNAKNAN